MRVLPLADPGVPDVRSPLRFLIWVVNGQRATLTGGMVFGIVWMCGQATVPFVVGRGIDKGITGHSTGALLTWSAVLLGVGIVQAASGVTRHRFAVAKLANRHLPRRATPHSAGRPPRCLVDAAGATRRHRQ